MIDNANIPINVLIIGAFPEDPSFIEGGVHASVYGLARSLRMNSFIGKIKIISLPQQASGESSVFSAEVDGLDVTWLHSYKFLSSGIIHLPLIIRHIRKSANPVVHIHGTGLLQAALIACMNISKTKFVWTLHGITTKETLDIYGNNPTFANLARHLFYKYLERFSINKSKSIIVDTPYVANEVKRIASENTPPRSIREKIIHTIAQGIFTSEFSNSMEISRDKPVILSVAILYPRKGHHLTIEAFALVKAKIPEARLIIAGTLPITGYYNQLKELASKLGVSDSVEFIIDMPRSDLIALFSKAKIFALHSKEESQGIVLCEALAAGLPVIATGIGGIPFVVTEGKDGFLVQYGDIERFAGHITSLLEDKGLYTEMSAAAKISAARFDWKNITDRVIKIYRGL